MNVHSASTESEVTAKADDSGTPHTDAACVSRAYIEREMDIYTQKFVLADFARQLERQRNELAKALRGLLLDEGLHSIGCKEYPPGYDDSRCCPVHIARVALGIAQTVASKE